MNELTIRSDDIDAPAPSPKEAGRSVVAPYVLGFVLIIAAHGVWVMLRTPSVPAAYSVLVAAVVLTALYGGYGPALLVTTLASLDLTSVFGTTIRNPATTGDSTLIVTCSAAALLSGALRRPRNSATRTPADHELLAVAERERQRIGHDLHDGLGQELTGISMLVRALAERLRAEGSATTEQAEQLSGLIRDSVRHAQDLAHGLSPVDLQENDLPLGLRRLCERTARLPNVMCAFVDRGRCAVSPGAAVHLYRIAQEATGNAMRHGRARNIVVSLNATDMGLTLRVADDGLGFVPQDVSTGLGLRLMEHRAAAIGGSLHVEGRGSGGTIVTCRVPLRRDHRHATDRTGADSG
ncbi:MAG TPA: ATP-binding protein [Tepidisphaeraceae bacterium]|jgi:signal transduction histidine kinase